MTAALSGRERECKLLRRVLDSSRSEFVAVYGRRRIGKTFLIRRFFDDEPVVRFELVGRLGASVADHMALFAESLTRTFSPTLPVAPPRSWQDALSTLARTIEATADGRRVVLFFDELPWLAGHRSGCLSAIEHFWNAWCSKRDDIILIVCGSAASWMLSKVVNARGGLHGRLTQTIRLLPFTLSELSSYASDRQLRMTKRQLAEVAMIVGGVPHYLDNLYRGQSIPQFVDTTCLDKDGALRHEFDRLFASLFDNAQPYVYVVKALAKRRDGLSRTDLIKQAKMQSGGGATTVLNALEQAGFIQQTIPFGRTSRDRYYRLTDPFCAFHLNWLARRPPARWHDVQPSPRWHQWVGLAFESLCLAHVQGIKQSLGIAGVRTEASGWRSPEAQLDLVIDRADDVISICEMKYTNEPFVITKAYAQALRKKLGIFRAATGTRKRLDLVMVTSSGVVDNRWARDAVDAQVPLDALF